MEVLLPRAGEKKEDVGEIQHGSPCLTSVCKTHAKVLVTSASPVVTTRPKTVTL